MQETLIWTSLRHSYPFTEHIVYKVKDCRHNVYGTAYYDGFYFEEPKWDLPKKGNLMLLRYEPTHWAE